MTLAPRLAWSERRGEALDHVLFVGPPGPGETTLGQIAAREPGVDVGSISGPAIAGALGLAAPPTGLENRGVAASAVAAALKAAGEGADSAKLIRLGLKELAR